MTRGIFDGVNSHTNDPRIDGGFDPGAVSVKNRDAMSPTASAFLKACVCVLVSIRVFDNVEPLREAH